MFIQYLLKFDQNSFVLWHDHVYISILTENGNTKLTPYKMKIIIYKN